jgi:hypothetical protein
MKNHVNSPNGLWKLTQAWHKMFSFLRYENWQITKSLSVHTSTKHSPCFLSQQEIFLQLSVGEFLALLFKENAESFITLKIFFITHNFLSCKWLYKNRSDIATHFYLTSGPVSSCEYLLKSVRKHTIHTWMWISLFSQDTMKLRFLLCIV